MNFVCLVPRAGPDRYVAITELLPETLVFLGATYRCTPHVTHGGWPIYKQQ